MALLLAACEKARQWSQVEVIRLRGGWNGNCRAGKRQRDDRDFWRGICGDERSGSRAEGKNSHVLSRDSRALARDGRDARAGLSLRWFRDQFGGGASYDSLMIEQQPLPRDRMDCFGALFDGRADAASRSKRARRPGRTTAQHTRAHVIRAILEGVAFSLRDTFTIFRELGVPVKSIRLGGGGARSYLWQQIQADIYGMPVDLVAAEEGAAYGAALLAGVGVGMWAIGGRGVRDGSAGGEAGGTDRGKCGVAESQISRVSEVVSRAARDSLQELIVVDKGRWRLTFVGR